MKKYLWSLVVVASALSLQECARIDFGNKANQKDDLNSAPLSEPVGDQESDDTAVA